MALDVTINVTNNQALDQLQNFTDQAGADRQIRGEILARDANGNITQLRLYTRKNDLANTVTTAGRGRKYAAARQGINAILNRHGQGAQNAHLNVLDENNNKLLGSSLKAAMASDQVLVNSQTTAEHLKTLRKQDESHQMRGIDNGDGSYILYSKQTTHTFGLKRRSRFTAFDQGIDKIFANTRQQDPRLGTLMQDLYGQKAVKSQGSPALMGNQFNKGKREVDTQAYNKAINALGIELKDRLPELQNHLFIRLNAEQLDSDPMRHRLGSQNIHIYGAMKKIQANRLNECSVPELMNAIQAISKANPFMPITALVELTRTDASLQAAGPYTGYNLPNQQPKVPFDSPAASPDTMRRAATDLHRAVNDRLTVQQKAALKQRVEFTAKLADVYDSQLGPCGNNLQGDNKALWTKAFNVNIGQQTGYDSVELAAAIGGTLLTELTDAKTNDHLSRDELRAMIPGLRDFAHNNPDHVKIDQLIDKLEVEIRKQPFNSREIKSLCDQLAHLVRRDSTVAPKDLMTSLVLHKDIIFPSQHRADAIGQEITGLDQQIDDLQQDQDRATTATEDRQLQGQINTLQATRTELLQQHNAITQALRHEAVFEEKHQVIDLRSRKAQLQEQITQAVSQQRWDDAAQGLGNLDYLIAKHQAKMDRVAHQHHLPPQPELNPTVRGFVEQEIPRYKAAALEEAKQGIDNQMDMVLETIAGHDRQQFIDTNIQTMSDDQAVQAQLHNQLDDTAFSSDNFAEIVPHQDSSKFVARFNNGRELVLSNRGSGNGEFRGEFLKNQLQNGNYSNLRDMIGQNFNTRYDSNLIYAATAARNYVKSAIDSNLKYVPGFTRQDADALYREYGQREIGNTTLGDIWALSN